MDLSSNKRKLSITLLLIAGVCCLPVFASNPVKKSAAARAGGLGVIRGVVRDQAGEGIADATVAIFRIGATKALKQVRSATDGSFIARIIPGTYTVMAVAEGFNSVTLDSVDVGRSADLVYGFKLVRAGSGNTLPERIKDGKNSKWSIRAANAQRTIYQNVEGRAPIDDDDSAADTASSFQLTGAGEERSNRKGQTVVESYFASSAAGNYTGLNFATLVPITGNAEIVFAGQASTARSGPGRFEAQIRYKPASRHEVLARTSVARLGSLKKGDKENPLGQFSIQALDQWTVREGVIVVFGVDYSTFLGAGKDSAISPRLGFQFDIDPKTRFRAAYTTQTEQKTWGDAIELEDHQVAFTEPVAVDDLVTVNGNPKLNKSRRIEFGIERVLDNRSSIEASAFFDLTLGRGVGLLSMPFDTLEGTGFGDLVANQQGKAEGVRVVYNRRFNSVLSAGGGYAFGNGQKLSDNALTDPSDVFENGYFQTVFGQLTADFSTGTNVRTIFRLSPQATVFAIDPFQGRLAIYDPGLSILVTQSLPTLGLPFHAQAMIDARNLFGFQTGVATDDGVLKLNSQQRMLRGGILVRF
jgi:hypothetical protein